MSAPGNPMTPTLQTEAYWRKYREIYDRMVSRYALVCLTYKAPVTDELFTDANNFAAEEAPKWLNHQLHMAEVDDFLARAEAAL